MNPLKKSVSLLLLALGALFGGCSLQPQKDTSIPWSRPAGWEGQIPGMGAPTGAR
jgi:hypothetical protein